MKDPYLYPNSEVLKNLQDITDANLLDKAEADCTGLRLRQLTEIPIEGDFGFSHLCSVHEFIFQDIFEWAGIPRIINISKSEPALGGLSIEYSDAFAIADDACSALNISKDLF